ncbi:MAG: hypothetical protein CBC29_07175 [Methylococcaceae bacterium TMED69]|nr:MAG: hypothetical protein CBC29_07175 [Methylococcaceae bacterium TMED69]|tara:strand:+ start:1285 stop:2145 length:861 start_codon:yes stop_codon:yes gene_type:complete
MPNNHYKDLNEAFVESLQNIRTQGLNVESRGTKQKEIIFYSLTIDDPTALSIEPRARRFNPDYAITEWLWYLSANSDVKNIGKLANIWNLIQDDEGKCESNYGCYLMGNQWVWVKNELLADPDTRRATLVINQPYHKGKNKADYPCTQYIHFFIRNNKLHMSINMRSNDAIFGFCNDVFTFCMFQQLMLNDLNASLHPSRKKIKLGKYHHNAGSFHVYEKHWNMMDKILENYYIKVFNDGWPTLNKFVLKNTITSDKIWQFCLPERDMTKEEIQEFTKTKGKEIYE